MVVVHYLTRLLISLKVSSMESEIHAPDSARSPALDALRAFMMGLGIVLHASMLYLADPPPTFPIPTDRNNSPVMNWLLHWIHSFRMPLFFLLSGWFTALMLSRRGLRKTLNNRLRRIGLPLLLGVFVILPVTGWLFVAFWLGARSGNPTLLPSRSSVEALITYLRARGMRAGEPSWMHLWFLWFLCLYFVFLLPAATSLQRYCGGLLERVGTWRNPWVQALAITVLAIGPLWFFRGGQVNDEFMYVRPHFPSLVYYGIFFVFGMLAQCQTNAFAALHRHLEIRALIGLVLLFVGASLARKDEVASDSSLFLHAASVLCNGLNSALWIGIFLGTALRWINTPGPWITYLARSSFWVYLIHLPLVGLAGWFLLHFDLPGLLKFCIVCTFTALISLWSYHRFVQSSWLSVLLNGQRFHMAWPGASRQ